MEVSTIWKVSINKPGNRRKFRSQTSDNIDRWKAEQGRGREKRKIRRKKSKKKEDADAQKGRKVAIHCVFPMICGSGRSKSRLAKAAGAEPAGQTRDEKLHAVVARSTFPSENVQNTPFSDHFWQLKGRKSARRCGAKHISKSKCTKHTMVGALLEVEMSKKCRPLWREARFEVRMHKTHHSRTTFGSWDVEKVYAVVARSIYKTHHGRSTFGSWDVEKVQAVVARSTFWSQNAQNTPASDHFWKFRSKKCTSLWREAHLEVKMLKTLGGRTTFGGSEVASLRFTRLHYITLHYTPLHYITLHSTTLQLQLQLHNYTPLRSTTLHYITLHYTKLHYTTLHYITPHYLPLDFTTIHYTTLHYTTQLHSTTLHYTPLH